MSEDLERIKDTSRHILDRYADLLAYLLSYDEKKLRLEHESTLHEDKVEQVSNSVKDFIDRFPELRTQVLQEALNVERNKIKAKYNPDIDSFISEITRIGTDKHIEIMKSRSEVTMRYAGETNEIDTIFEDVILYTPEDKYHVEESCKNTSAATLKAVKKIHKKFKQAAGSVVEKEALCTTLMNKISLTTITAGDNAKAALFIFSAILIGSELISIFFAKYVFALLLIVSYLSTRVYATNKIRYIKLCTLGYQTKYAALSYKDVLSEKINTDTDKETAVIETNFAEKLRIAEQNKMNKEEEMQRELSTVDDLLNDDNFKNNVLQSQLQTLENLQKQLDGAKEELAQFRTDYNEFLNSKTELIELKSNLQNQIIADYITNMEPGTSVTIVDKLLLGFDSEDKIITIDNMCRANIILYDEGISSCYDLAMLIITQIFNTYRITILDISVTDISSMLVPFRVFETKELEENYKCITTSGEFKDIVSTLYESIRIKSRRIKSRSEDIRQFNELMYKTNSLPESLSFLIVLNAGDLLFSDELLKMCADGESYGICPFLFVSKQKFYDLINAESPSEGELKGYVHLFESVKDWYDYSPSHDIFSKCGDFIREDYINKAKKKIK